MVMTISARLQRDIIVNCGGEIRVPVNQPVRLTIPKTYPAGSGYTWALLGPIPRPELGEVLVFGEETASQSPPPGAPVTTTWLLEWLSPVDKPLGEEQRPNEELRFALVRPWETSRPVEECHCKVIFEQKPAN